MRTTIPRPAATALALCILLSLIASTILGCTAGNDAGGAKTERGDGAAGARPTIRGVAVADTIVPAATDQPVALAAAKNEWTSFAVELAGLPKGGTYSLRLRPPKSKADGSSIAASNFEPFQILPMPTDVNRAGYVRHTGQNASAGALPRALLPLGTDNGLVNLKGLRDPVPPTAGAAPADAPAAGPLQLWVDLHVPADAAAGDYTTTCDLIDARQKEPVASLALKLTVYDFALPNERHLQLVGRLPWESLVRLYPDRFETVTPRLVNRHEEKYAGTVRVLDQLVSLAQKHRTTVVVPRLQPTVKWPAGKPPEIDWTDFDALVGPWMNGQTFPDRTALGFWPLPTPDYLDRFDPKSRADYLTLAATHFDQFDWIDRAPLWLEKTTPGRIRPADTIELSAEAAEVMALHPRVRVTLPLENDQLQLADPNQPKMIPPPAAPRLWATAPELVFSPPVQKWPESAQKPDQWLRTDNAGLVPYVGAGGDDRDVRLWAWLAFLREAKLISFSGVLPTLNDPTQPADPNELIWFYPGEWFGVTEPVPTVQLKWLRRAEQDYEYLRLARERGEILNALVMARLMTKPVEIQPGQVPDPSYALMCGTTDPTAWAEAQELLAQTILLREPGKEPDPDRQHDLYVRTLRWMQPQERPLLMGRTTQWFLEAPPHGGDKQLKLRLGIDLYNASDVRPDKNQLQWTALPPGWEVKPQPIEIPALSVFHVRRETVEAAFDLTKITAGPRQSAELTFVNGFTNRPTTLKLVLPVAASERVEGRRLAIDGKLDEWEPADLIQDGRLVRMLDRPNIQRQALEGAEKDAKVYTGWADDHFYLAFGLDGIDPERLKFGGQNFVDYQFRRAWGEDLCEAVIQPVYDDGHSGPVLHVVCKPTGHWVERKLDPRLNANPWQPYEGAGIRYKAIVNGERWLGEVAIPWEIINDPKRGGRPALLRFNFVQHRTATGETASWAGPIDFGRDDAFTGVLHLREVDAPGVAPVVRDSSQGR